MILSIIAGAVGILSTVLAWNLNPKRRIYAELDEIYHQLDELYKERDYALAHNESDALTVVTAAIVRLCNRKTVLLQRLR